MLLAEQCFFVVVVVFFPPVLSNHIKVKKYEAQSHEL